MVNVRKPPPGIKAATRRDVFARDGGHCAECGVVDPKWAHDHQRPLWQARLSDNPGWFWSLENSQSLCTAHHAVKTKIEAKMRAKERRIRRKLAGEKRRVARIPSRPFPKVHRPLRKRLDGNKTKKLAYGQWSGSRGNNR